MVQEAAKFVDELTDMPKKLELIDTLRTVTDGKVRFPVQRPMSNNLRIRFLLKWREPALLEFS